MRTLYRHQATLLRKRTGGEYNEDGDWVTGDHVFELNFPCCIQPYTEISEKINLPEGVTEKDCRVMWTHANVLIANEIKQLESDEIRYNGTLYVVYKEGEWNNRRIKASEAVLIKKDKL